MATNNCINASNPITVASGGTGVASMTTAYAPVIAGTTATGALQVASSGLSTSGFTLTSQGNAAVPTFTPQAAAGSMVLIQTQTASSSTTIDFTTGITGYTKYCIMYSNVTLASSSYLGMRISTNAGGSWIADTDYFSDSHFYDFNSTTLQSNAVGSGSAFNISTGTLSTTVPSSGVVWFYNFGAATKISYLGEGAQLDSGTIAYVANNGYRDNTSTVNGIRFFTGAANISTGNFSLYGVTT